MGSTVDHIGLNLTMTLFRTRLADTSLQIMQMNKLQPLKRERVLVNLVDVSRTSVSNPSEAEKFGRRDE